MQHLRTFQHLTVVQLQRHARQLAALDPAFTDGEVIPGLGQRLDTVRHDLVVTIQEIHIIARRSLHTRITGSRETAVLRVLRDLEVDSPVIVLDHPFHNLHTVVLSAVVHEDTLHRAQVRLTHHAPQTVTDVRRYVIDWYNDRYLHNS